MRPKSSVEVFEIINRDFDVLETAKRLYDLFKKKESADVARIHGMISLFESSGCLAMKLSGYFGETISATLRELLFLYDREVNGVSG